MVPYPDPSDRDYCPGSHHQVVAPRPRKNIVILVVNDEAEKQWHRCPECGRLIVAMPNGRLFPHVNNVKRARKKDQVQESLVAFGLNKRSEWR